MTYKLQLSATMLRRRTTGLSADLTFLNLGVRTRRGDVKRRGPGITLALSSS